MSRKTKIKNLKRVGQKNLTQKMKASVGGSGVQNPLHGNFSGNDYPNNHYHDKKSSEYTVILLENDPDLNTDNLKKNLADKIFDAMTNPNNRQEPDNLSTNRENQVNRGDEKNNVVNPFEKTESEIKGKIKNGIYIENIEETPNTRSRGATFTFSPQTNTPSEKYLGITLHLSYLKKETGMKEVDIFGICRDSN